MNLVSAQEYIELLLELQDLIIWERVPRSSLRIKRTRHLGLIIKSFRYEPIDAVVDAYLYIKSEGETGLIYIPEAGVIKLEPMSIHPVAASSPSVMNQIISELTVRFSLGSPKQG